MALMREDDGEMWEIRLQKISEDRWHDSKMTMKSMIMLSSVADPVYCLLVNSINCKEEEER